MERKCVLTEGFARYEEVEISAHDALVSLLQERVYYCKQCSMERADGSLLFHVVGDTTTQALWDQAVASVNG